MKSVKIVFVLLLAGLSFSATHPFHASITKCNADENALEITVRVFSEDLAQAIGEKSLIVEEEVYKDEDQLESQGKKIQEYIQDNFSLSKGDKIYELHDVGHEVEFDITFVYFEITDFELGDSYEISQTLLFDQFEDQTNIVNLVINDKTYSDYFTPSQTTKTFEIE